MLKIFNSLSKKLVEFEPLEAGKVRMYACGPTVYSFSHIGHGRKYVNDDVLRRVLENAESLQVKHVQNITDVGHLVSDGDEGEDKMEKGAEKYGKTVWEVAKEFAEFFDKEMELLNVEKPTVSCKATEHIPEQIEMIEKLVDKGFAYETPEAIYFEVAKFPDYGKLFGQNLTEKLVGVRDEVVTDANKKSPLDFALWFKRVGKFSEHVMHWESPWGDGFPGWHIECSAMSTKYLGDQFDIHTGGEDHLSIHHPNEIAQSEAATGKKPFVKYWFHSAFLTVDGKKMSKSLGNVYSVADIVAKGYSPMALRYLYLSTHYRKTMNFTWEALEAAQNAVDRLFDKAMVFGAYDTDFYIDKTKSPMNELVSGFNLAVEDDLNMPKALSTLWSGLDKVGNDDQAMYFLEEVDKVLGLRIKEEGIKRYKAWEEKTRKNHDLIALREKYRSEKNWVEADKIRDQLIALGLEVKDK